MTCPMVGSEQFLAKHKKTEQGIGIVYLPSIQILFTGNWFHTGSCKGEKGLGGSWLEYIFKDKAYDELD